MEPRLWGTQAGRVDGVQAGAGRGGRFRLLRYFTVATFFVFLAAGIALVVLQRGEEKFFDQVQREQQLFFAKAQVDLARQDEAAARASLLAVHESSHVMLTRVVANMLWAADFAPVVALAQALSDAHCRALPRGESAASTAAAERRACFAELGRRIMALRGYANLDAKAYAAMEATRVFKIKVWDLRGVTIYSSEYAQIGEDGAANEGWREAVAGRPASELTHRDRFSAFEGIVENRDLISTYVPVRDEKSGAVVGVFELYSDVTPFLEQIRVASNQFADIAAANNAQVEQTARARQDAVNAASVRFLSIVGGLLLLLYAASLLIVFVGQRVIDRQNLAQEQATQREQLWHREKMAALAAMAANVSHEVGNPLAVIAGVAQQLPDKPAAPGTGGVAVTQPSHMILEQTARIARMMRRISDFADARSEAPEWVDVNAMVKAVCDFMTFDQRLRGSPIEFRGAAGLPARELVPDHLNEVMMNLLQACAETIALRARSGQIIVETAARADEVVVRIGCDAATESKGHASVPFVDETRVVPARRRLVSMGAALTLGENSIEVALPQACRPAEEMPPINGCKEFGKA